MKFSGPVKIFVKLHRPPPEIRIFLPILSELSITNILRPRLAASIAHINPAAPAPMMITSFFNNSIYQYPYVSSRNPFHPSHIVLSRLRYWIASLICEAEIFSSPPRSAIVRDTFNILS